MKSFKRIFILLLLVCCVFSRVGNAQNLSDSNDASDPIVTEEFIGDDLKVVLDYLAEETKISIKYDDSIEGKVTCKFDKVPLSKVLEVILSATPYKIKKMDDNYLVYFKDTSPGEVLGLTEPAITNNFVNDDLLTVLDMLSADTGTNIMYGMSVQGVVSCKLEKVPLGKALEIILAGTPYKAVKRDNYFVVTEIAAGQKQLQISGKIGIANVKMEGLPGEVNTDTNGYYTASVDAGFSGKIKPVKEGYKFNPSFVIYNNTRLDRKMQNYKAAKMSSDQTVQKELNDPVVSGVFVSEDLIITLNEFAERTKINIMYDSSIAGIVTCRLNRVPLSKSLEIISSPTDYIVKKMDDYYLITSPALDDIKNRDNVEKDTETDEPVVANKLINEVITEPNVTDTFVDDDLLVVLNTISSDTGINIVYGNNVMGIVNCRLKNVPLSKALEIILAATPYTAKKRDNYYVVTEHLSSGKRYQISGNAGIANVRMNGLPGEIYADVNGYYNANVEAGFSGKVQPVKEGYNFNPSYIIYNNLDSKRIKQDYKANEVSLNQNAQKELSDPLISKTLMDDELWDVLNTLAEETGINIILDSAVTGIVTCRLNNVPLSKALEIILSATPYIIKKMDDYYLVISPELDDIKNQVSSNKNSFSGKKEISFSPPINQDSTVTQDSPIQNDNSQKRMLTISDTLETKNGPFSGVNITANPGDIKTVTDDNGQFSIQVPYGWSGEITMTKPGIKFTPESRSFKNVTTDIKH